MARSGGNATRICEVDEASQHGLAPPSLHSCTAAESALDMINPRSLYIQKRTQRLVPFPPTVENLNNLLQSASKTDMFPPRSSPSQLPFASHYSDYLPSVSGALFGRYAEAVATDFGGPAHLKAASIASSSINRKKARLLYLPLTPRSAFFLFFSFFFTPKYARTNAMYIPRRHSHTDARARSHAHACKLTIRRREKMRRSPHCPERKANDKIAKENMALLNRLSNIRPSKDLAGGGSGGRPVTTSGGRPSSRAVRGTGAWEKHEKFYSVAHAESHF